MNYVRAMSSSVTRMDYLGRFLDAVDSAQAGKAGAIADDKWLQWNHRPEFTDILARHLDHGSSRVRTEVIVLLTRIADPSHVEKIASMRREDIDTVAAACVGYLAGFESRRRLIDELMEELRTGYGEEFKQAAKAMVPVAAKEDLSELRRIMGELDSGRREMIREILDGIICRNPELEDVREGIMSLPIEPDADSYNSFLDKAFDYLDVRYRKNIHPSRTIDGKTRSNVNKALRAIAARHYLEAANMEEYSDDLRYEHQALGALIQWCSDDLWSKERTGVVKRSDPLCPGCESPMRMYKSQWYCPGCGTRKE